MKITIIITALIISNYSNNKTCNSGNDDRNKDNNNNNNNLNYINTINFCFSILYHLAMKSYMYFHKFCLGCNEARAPHSNR